MKRTPTRNPDGTHTDWSTPQILPTTSGKRWDTYLLPHVAPDGTVWTTTTNNPSQQNFSNASISLIWSSDGGVTWQGPLPVLANVNLPTYQNTTFREGIVNTFAVGQQKIGGFYPLYVSYEDGSSGLSNVYLIASYQRRADVDRAHPGQRQRRPDRGLAAQPRRRAGRHGGGHVLRSTLALPDANRSRCSRFGRGQ